MPGVCVRRFARYERTLKDMPDRRPEKDVRRQVAVAVAVVMVVAIETVRVRVTK